MINKMTRKRFVVVFIFFLTYKQVVSTSNFSSKNDCTGSSIECFDKNRQVCGTDGVTYKSKCHLMKAKCEGVNVNIKYVGECKDKCTKLRTYALSGRQKLNHIPKCREDGSYAPIQCFENNKCWCVNSHGISTSQIFQGRPNCSVKENKKRSSSNLVPRKKCTPNDRAAFNTAFLTIFSNEISKLKVNNGVSNDFQIIEWKFKQLDQNKNNMLENNEYQGLKKIAKMVVKPKRCGRRFGKFCDKNKDLNISREEFHGCLNKDLQHISGGGRMNGLNSDDSEKDDYFEENSNESISSKHAENRLGLKDKTTLNLHNESNGSTRSDLDDEINDCLKDRKNVLEDKTDQLFLPQCESDGRFKRIQCYRSTGYCWCVNEDTGKPIPGSSTKDKIPQCDSYVPIRTMIGCPGKTEFLKELKEFLKTHTFSNVNLGADNTKWGTEDERISTLSFVLLDKNKNKVWERKEWKTFRDLIEGIKNLRRCGKRLPRFCDVNNDKKITLSEWLNCLQTQRVQGEKVQLPLHHEPIFPAQTKLKGKKNPLESYLKAD